MRAGTADLAGLTADNVGKVDAAVVSEPMTGSQAYSLVLLRLKDKADAREIADSMEEKHQHAQVGLRGGR